MMSGCPASALVDIHVNDDADSTPPPASSSGGEPVVDESTGADASDSTGSTEAPADTSTGSTGAEETSGTTDVQDTTAADTTSTGDESSSSTGDAPPPPPPLLGLTEVCTDDSQCESGLCGAQNSEGGLGRCTVACKLDASPVNDCAAQGHPGLCLVHYGQFVHCEGAQFELPLQDPADDRHIEPGVAFSAALPFVDKDLHLLRPGADKYTVTVSAPKKVIVQVFQQDGTLIDTFSNPLPNTPIVLKIDAYAEPRWLLVSDDSNGTAYQLTATLGW